MTLLLGEVLALLLLVIAIANLLALFLVGGGAGLFVRGFVDGLISGVALQAEKFD